MAVKINDGEEKLNGKFSRFSSSSGLYTLQAYKMGIHDKLMF